MVRISGQDIGNPMPPSLITVPHEGHKADPDAWTRTKDHRYRSKQAKQHVDTGKGDKWMESFLIARHHD